MWGVQTYLLELLPQCPQLGVALRHAIQAVCGIECLLYELAQDVDGRDAFQRGAGVDVVVRLAFELFFVEG